MLTEEKWEDICSNSHDIWNSVKNESKAYISESEYKKYIRPISYTKTLNREIFLKVSTRFLKSKILDEYQTILLNIWKKHDCNIEKIIVFCGQEPSTLKKSPTSKIERKSYKKSEQLPLWSESARGIPNAIIRGCLFGAIHGKSAQYRERETILQEKNLKIIFTGKQLTQTDLNVWEQILHMCRMHNLGYEIQFSANSFLKSIGKSTGKKDHEYLKNVLSKLNACSVEITHNGISYFGSLIEGGCRDENLGRYKLSINSKIAKLYTEGFTLTNWEERKAIGNRPLALWIHHYIASHAIMYPTKIETFHRLSGSNTKCLRRFKVQMKDALQHLLDLSIIKSFHIDKNIISIENIPTKAQKKYIKSQ